MIGNCAEDFDITRVRKKKSMIDVSSRNTSKMLTSETEVLDVAVF